MNDTIELFKKTPTEELLTEERLREYLERGIKLKHYIGFEVSGLVHLGTGLICMQKVADLQKAGVKTTVFLADYHSWVNKKLGGDLDTIRRVAGGYFKEALKMALSIVGGDPNKTEFILGSRFYEKIGIEYFESVLKVAMKTTLSRIKRSTTIMGRKTVDSLSFAQLLYVPMQVADIFSLGVNVAHGGMDQRKAHVIAIEIGEKAFGYKPIAIHHHVLMGLHASDKAISKIIEAKQKGNRDLLEEGIIEIKMSKSVAESAIFIHDTPEQIRRKIRKAYCPMGIAEFNPILEFARYIVFRDRKEPLEIINKKTGERAVFASYDALEKAYIEKKVHPSDLKDAIAEELIRILEPARRYFLEGSGKRYLEPMKEIQITR